MSKLGLIIKREYLTRVKKKSFIILSLLAPIGMLLMMFLPILIEEYGGQSDCRIAVVDYTEKYGSSLTDRDNLSFVRFPNNVDIESLRIMLESNDLEAYLVIDGSPDVKDNVKLYSSASLSIDVVMDIESELSQSLRQHYLNDYNGHSAELDSLFSKVNNAKAEVKTININEDGMDCETSAAVGTIVAIIAMFLIYMFVLISGSMVMSSVMEEKSSRIIEVLVSSVKPFDLMMGKIIGIALMTLTQFAIWIVVGGILLFISTFIIVAPEVTQISGVQAEAINSVNNTPEILNELMQTLQSVNVAEIMVYFVIYFLGGYLLYASIFACIGASVETQSDGQQLMTPVTILIIIAMYLAMYAIHDPHGTISVAGSIFPFTSPVVMMARIPFNVPLWQLLLSLAVLICSFIFTTWFAGRVYRVGILMYGKKPSLKEIWTWFKQVD